jgi:rubrerythrin
MVKLFRCNICGDPYIGDSAPSRCPFCGAYEKYMVPIEKYSGNFNVELNETDKKNVEYALEVEISNTAFYFCAAEKTETENKRKLFKALGKVEKEHASIWKKILKLDKIDIPESFACSESDGANLKESHDREARAIAFYKKAEKEAENARVKQLFRAIVEIEEDHLTFSEGAY